MRSIRARFPHLPELACFDTAFPKTAVIAQSRTTSVLGLPTDEELMSARHAVALLSAGKKTLMANRGVAAGS